MSKKIVSAKIASGFSLDDIDSLGVKKEKNPPAMSSKRTTPPPKCKPVSSRKRKNSEPSTSDASPLPWSKLQDAQKLITLGHDQLLTAFNAIAQELQESQETISDLRKISVQKDVYLDYKIKQLEKAKIELKVVKA